HLPRPRPLHRTLDPDAGSQPGRCVNPQLAVTARTLEPFAAAMCQILTLACAAVLATGPWRSYQVYQPDIQRRFVVDAGSQPLKYNHDSSIAWYGDRWFCLWNANEPAFEGKPGQLNYVATSRDGQAWTPPKPAFSSPECSVNPVPCTKGTQWQPNLIVVGGELWAVWSQNSGDPYNGCYVSRLSAPEGKWHNERLTWNGSDEAEIDGKRWRIFPTQNPVQLSTGRVLAPVTMMGGPAADAPTGLSGSWWRIEKRDSVLYTDDGRSWHASPGAVQPGRTWAQWEPTVWQRDDGTVMMFARNNDHRTRQEGGPRPAEMLLWSKSSDGGANWTPHQAVPLETVASRMHVVAGSGDRFLMVHNDWPAGQFVGDRQNLALFFSRGGGIDFVAGTSVTGEETIVAYPQMWIHQGQMAVSYSQGRQYRSIKVALIKPLPDPEHYYLFPRANTPRGPAPTNRDGSLCFQGEQHLETRRVIDPGKEAFSLGAWVCSDEGGTLLDNRSSAPAGGLLWGIRGAHPYVYLGTPERNIESSLVLESGRCQYTGVSVDNRAGTASFFVGDRTETIRFTAPAPRPFRAATAYVGKKRFESSQVPGFSGRIRRLWLCSGTCLDAAGHAWLFNQAAEEWGFRRRPDAVAPGREPAIRLDPADSAALAEAFTFPSGSVSTVETATAAGLQVLRFRGNASAGVDLDRNDRPRGDRVELELRFHVEEGSGQVLATVGDADKPARVVVEERQVFLAAAGEKRPLGTVSAGDWSTLRMATGARRTTASLDDGQPETVRHDPAATWIYLGDGYPDRHVSPPTSFTIDLASVRSRVIIDVP
ncbi:MAG: sialidase family protein, partial [Thermoguttaceae bacterium]